MANEFYFLIFTFLKFDFYFWISKIKKTLVGFSTQGFFIFHHLIFLK